MYGCCAAHTVVLVFQVNLPMFLQKEPFPKLEILDETNQCNTFKENLQFALRLVLVH